MSTSIVTNDRYSYMDESSIDRLLKCSLCKKPFVEPVSTPDGNCFCRSCITQILLKSSSSETTRTNLMNGQQSVNMQNFTAVTERLVLQMLDSLLVRCTKCGETDLKRGELHEHESEYCTQAAVLCHATHYKCPWVGKRQQLQEHLNECQYLKLRPALEELFNENAQLKTRVENLEKQIEGLLNN